MKHAFCTLRQRRALVVNPTAKTDVPGRQVVKVLGSRSGRQSRERALAAYFSFEARERFFNKKRNSVPDDDVVVDMAESRGTMPEATKPLDGVSVSLDFEEGEMVIVADGRKDRVPVGKSWSFC